MRFKEALLACAVVAAMAAPAAAQNADVIGTWSLSFNSTQGVIPATMILKKDGDKIVGTISSELGQADLEAAVKEKALTVGFGMQMNGGDALNVTLNATVDGDTMKGTFDLNGGGDGGDFSGTREKDPATDAKGAQADQAKDAAKVDVTGNWSLQVTTDTISASPSVSLKQEGEKLTGQYTSSQYGAFPLTGTVTADKIAFTVSMTIEGNAISAYFEGTATKDGLKGTVAYGDFAQGTFTGTRAK